MEKYLTIDDEDSVDILEDSEQIPSIRTKNSRVKNLRTNRFLRQMPINKPLGLKKNTYVYDGRDFYISFDTDEVKSNIGRFSKERKLGLLFRLMEIEYVVETIEDEYVIKAFNVNSMQKDYIVSFIKSKYSIRV